MKFKTKHFFPKKTLHSWGTLEKCLQNDEECDLNNRKGHLPNTGDDSIKHRRTRQVSD